MKNFILYFFWSIQMCSTNFIKKNCALKKLFLDLKIPKEKYSEIRLLDIGCGNGDFIKYCTSLGIKTLGSMVFLMVIVTLNLLSISFWGLQ